jgi:hypothetical protein
MGVLYENRMLRRIFELNERKWEETGPDFQNEGFHNLYPCLQFSRDMKEAEHWARRRRLENIIKIVS